MRRDLPPPDLFSARLLVALDTLRSTGKYADPRRTLPMSRIAEGALYNRQYLYRICCTRGVDVGAMHFWQLGDPLPKVSPIEKEATQSDTFPLSEVAPPAYCEDTKEH